MSFTLFSLMGIQQKEPVARSSIEVEQQADTTNLDETVY
jgi:hypothetical protein